MGTERRARRLALVCVATAGLTVALAGPVTAHAPSDEQLVDDGVLDSGKETHHHDSQHHQQHGEEEGHLPPVSDGVSLVGHIDLFGEEEQPGRVADVSAYGNYAYLTAFRDPVCERGGVQVVDISDPAAPVAGPFIPSHVGTYSGEGSQVIHLETRHFTGEVLVFQNEICPGFENTGIGGVTLIDVTDPLKPKKLVEGFGDFSNPGRSQRRSNQVHSAFAWVNPDTGRAYAVMTDDEEVTDVDIIEITNPSRPRWVADYDLTDYSEQALGAVHGDAVFLHDEVVKRIDGRDIALLSYWDGGYILLDVTDPANALPLDHSDFAAVDPVAPERGLSPEGNAHYAEFTADNQYVVATDEDFDPYRVQATMEDGTVFTAVQGSDVPRIDEDTSLAGGTRFVGLACDAGTIPAADADHTIAVIERGVCDFTVKVQLVEAAGYDGAIVFNRTGVDGCEALISMLVEAGIPAVFVSRTDGFRLLGGVPADYTCDDTAAATGTAAPPVGTEGQDVVIAALFDGWGYVHLFDAATMEDLDQYFIPESQDPAYAEGFGDLSVHEVATDPAAPDIVYVSYYAGGFRILQIVDGELQEIGAFIDDGGNNFWGVEVHEHPDGNRYVLASDRDAGVYIFEAVDTT
jgi:hypothetical protein